VWNYFRRQCWSSRLCSSRAKPTVSKIQYTWWSTTGLPATAAVPGGISSATTASLLPGSTTNCRVWPDIIRCWRPVPGNTRRQCWLIVWPEYVPRWRAGHCGYCPVFRLGWELVLGQKDSPEVHPEGLPMLLTSVSFCVMFATLLDGFTCRRNAWFAGMVRRFSTPPSGWWLVVWLSGSAQVSINIPGSYSTPGPVSAWMGDRLWVGKLSRYVTSHPGQLSLAIPLWVGPMSTSLSCEGNRRSCVALAMCHRQ